MKIFQFLALGTLLFFTTQSQAQFGGLLNNLKSIAEQAAQTSSQKQVPASNPNQTNQDNEKWLAQPPMEAASQGKNSNSSVSNIASKNLITENNRVSQFRAIWCKSIDASANSPIDFKDIRVGDLCLAPDDLISALFDNLKSNNKQYEWMVSPATLKEGISITSQYLISGERRFSGIGLMINPFKEKVYISSFVGVFCAADTTNNLNEGNPFRKALEGKYGIPASAYTEYDQIKAEIDGFEAMVSKSKSQAITVKEAKDAREAENILNALRPRRATANKNIILSLTWDYEKGNKSRPIGSAVVSQANPVDLRDTGRCEVKVDQGGGFKQDYGFALSVNGTKKIIAIAEEIGAANDAKQNEKIKSAPAPKF